MRMQLTPVPVRKQDQVRLRLIAASCALLGASAVRADDGVLKRTQDWLDSWNANTALAYYHEDGRIQAVEPVVTVSKVLRDESTLSFVGTFDALSGASPNGAIASRNAQTFTSPSGTSLTGGKNLYTVSPGRLPVDPSYSDVRMAISGNWDVPVNRITNVNVGSKLSFEDDFVSISNSLSLARDFNDKNTTLSVGFNNEFDSIKPVGGTPVPSTDYSSFDKTHTRRSKDGVGVIAGITQVMTPDWLMAFNLSADRFHGYLTDPYKIISVLDAGGSTVRYDYEKRPDQRLRKSALLDNRVGGTNWSAGLSLRYMSDDWHVRSDTAEFHVRWIVGEQYIEPTIRWYRQSAANFYRAYLPDASTAQTEYASADSRLAQLHAWTYGLKYAKQLSAGGERPPSELSVRLEYYQQTFSQPTNVPGALQGLDLVPSLKAILFQVGWRF
jgi:hypothetical protein